MEWAEDDELSVGASWQQPILIPKVILNPLHSFEAEGYHVRSNPISLGVHVFVFEALGASSAAGSAFVRALVTLEEPSCSGGTNRAVNGRGR